MDLGDFIASVERIPELEARIAELEERFAEKPRLPEWVTLRQACEYAGTSYSTLRRPEYRDRRPSGGRKINGTMRYPRASVEEWARGMGL